MKLPCAIVILLMTNIFKRLPILWNQSRLAEMFKLQKDMAIKMNEMTSAMHMQNEILSRLLNVQEQRLCLEKIVNGVEVEFIDSV